MNSGDLFRINLPGINILISLYLDAIEYYLQIDFQSYLNNYSGIMKRTNRISLIYDHFILIRLKSIQILMSIISLPFHYEHLEQYSFEDYLEKSHDVQITTKKTFSEYRLRIIPLLLLALQTEQDTTNTQYLFGWRIKKENNIFFLFLMNSIFIGTIRLACSLIAYYEQARERITDDMKQGNMN